MSGYLSASRIYGHLWGAPRIRALFTDEGRLRAWLDILVVLAEAQAAVGLVPPAAAAAIRDRLTDWTPDPDDVGTLTRATGHSTLGLIRVLQERLPESAREWVYYGATVQDLTDTWSALVMREVANVVDDDLRAVEDSARALATRHRDTLMCGRTHGQPGLPITFGFKAAVWLDEVGRHRQRLAEGRSRRELVQLGGGLGSREFWGSAAEPLVGELADRLGLGIPTLPWLTARDGLAEFTCTLAMVAATAAKVGDEVYQLQRPEIGELAEPMVEGTVGSITMPHKRNPEWSEQLSTLARLARVQADLAIEAMVHGHERDGRAWKTEWAILPEISLSATRSSAALASLLGGLHVDADRMLANLEAQQGYVLSEPVMRALAAHVGKHSAHQIVYQATLAGRESGMDLRAALRTDPRLDAIGDEELDRLLDPRRALGSIPELVDRVLGQRP